jgi:hypothetical protein
MFRSVLAPRASEVPGGGLARGLNRVGIGMRILAITGHAPMAAMIFKLPPH